MAAEFGRELRDIDKPLMLGSVGVRGRARRCPPPARACGEDKDVLLSSLGRPPSSSAPTTLGGRGLLSFLTMNQKFAHMVVLFLSAEHQVLNVEIDNIAEIFAAFVASTAWQEY